MDSRQAFKVSGCSWGERAEKADYDARREFESNFYRQCDVRQPDDTTDIHWPMTLSLRAPVMAADSQRSAKAKAKARGAEQRRTRIRR